MRSPCRRTGSSSPCSPACSSTPTSGSIAAGCISGCSIRSTACGVGSSMQSGLAFSGRRRTPLVLQTEATECGLACLAMVAGYHGYRTDLATLRGKHSVSQKGTTLAGLIKIAAHLNLNSRPLRLDLDALDRLRMPAILHWDLNH